jgi:predicted Rossmann-fold nucleotide-binding protein
LFGREFWTRVVNWDALVEEGVIAPHDLEIFHWCEDANEAWDFVQRFYEEHPAPEPVQTAPPE